MDCTYAADIVEQADRWLQEGRPVALATIVSITGSSSRPLGTRMICTDQDEFAGAVSGGCVETDVCRIGREVLAGNQPHLVHYGSVRDPIFEVGLNCEGAIDVLIEPIDHEWTAAARAPFIGVVLLQCRFGHPPAAGGGTASGGTTPVEVNRTWYPSDMPYGGGLVRDAWQRATPRTTRTTTNLLFAEPVLPPPTLLIFGAGPVADDLARLAGVLGYSTVISDPRAARFTPGQSPAGRTCVTWPDETLRGLRDEGLALLPGRTFVVSLEHEPRFEDALWTALLNDMASTDDPRRPAYIGAIGKGQRAIERDQRAREAGVDLSPLAPIRTPVGLDIGGKQSGEVALSILAEIVATIHDRPGGPHGAPRPIPF